MRTSKVTYGAIIVATSKHRLEKNHLTDTSATIIIIISLLLSDLIWLIFSDSIWLNFHG